MLNERLITLRSSHNYSKKHVAKHLNMTPEGYGYYESGKRKPSPETIRSLANLYNVTTDYLLGITDDKHSSETCVSAFSKTLGMRVRAARGKKSLRDFSKECGISHTHLDSLEKGYDPRTGKPVSIRWDTLMKLSIATGYSVHYLVGDTDNPHIEPSQNRDQTIDQFDRSTVTMTKEKLRTYLCNRPLMQALEQKKDIDEIRRGLISALSIMRTADVQNEAVLAVQSKYDEYKKISLNYGVLIQDTWGVRWQDEKIILKHTDCLEDEIDRLPDIVRAG